MKVTVKTLENKEKGQIELSEAIYGLPIRADILHRMVEWQRARKQRGTHKVKTIAEISGTGKKPFKQKGTGNARQGTLRASQMRGGQTVFGPVVRSHAYNLTKKFRSLGLKTALSSKLAQDQLIVVDKATFSSNKTKDMKQTLAKLNLTNALFIDGPAVDENFKKAIQNIPYIDVLPSQGANVYDILRHKTLVLTEAGVAALEERFHE